MMPVEAYIYALFAVFCIHITAIAKHETNRRTCLHQLIIIIVESEERSNVDLQMT